MRLASLQRTTDLTTEPVSVTEVKAHAGIETSADDTLLGTMITAVRLAFEDWTGHMTGESTWDAYYDGAPGADRLLLPKSPAVSVSGVTYYETDNTERTFSAAKYTLVGDELLLDYAQTWPIDLRPRAGFRVTFVAGYTTVPEDIRAALKNAVALMYEQRGTCTDGAMPDPVSTGLLSVMERYKRRRL